MLSRRQLANALRILTIDSIEKSKSGHPGAPMGMADMAEALWHGILRHNPANPKWINRDRFVLSNGHASMLLYGLLHLTGYDVSMDDIKEFRQLGSITPGHPEYGLTPGVESTAGPLGQGIATAVGMALAEKLLAAEFNRTDFPIIDHYTYVFLGDGCLMEGISQEAISLAGVLNLKKLIVLYDQNGISIDGNVNRWFTDDTPGRFAACGWNVIADIDGQNGDAVAEALSAARKADKPTLICCRTAIGFGAPTKCGTAACHGSPLGTDEAAAARAALEWTYPPFEIPKEQYKEWDTRKQGAIWEKEWNELFDAYKAKWPVLAATLAQRMSGTIPGDVVEVLNEYIKKLGDNNTPVATRAANKNTLDHIAPLLPGLFGISADLSGSVGTKHAMAVPINLDMQHGNYFSCGVREFGMSALMNGLALHGGFIPYGGTFLVFSDYERSAIRLAALMKQRVVHVLTHDSIGVGEDGPTHQPVEHTPSLRMIPDVNVWRPCDATETAAAWLNALQTQGPTCLALTRQSLPAQPRTEAQSALIAKGGYILKECEGTPNIILIATGSEVQLTMAAADILGSEGYLVRVVSMPCTELFDKQDAAYREHVLPTGVRRRIAVEAAATDGWWKYTGLDGAVIGMNTFGASAPASMLFQKFGITTQAIVDRAKAMLTA